MNKQRTFFQKVESFLKSARNESSDRSEINVRGTVITEYTRDNAKIETSLIKSARDYIFKICGRDFHNVAGWISYVCPLTICTNVVLIF